MIDFAALHCKKNERFTFAAAIPSFHYLTLLFIKPDSYSAKPELAMA